MDTNMEPKRRVLDLRHDYQTLQKKNADDYELFLSDLLLSRKLLATRCY